MTNQPEGIRLDYEIIATLGPGSESEDGWRAMLQAGATAFRLNTSHLSLDQLQSWLERIDHFRATSLLGFPVVLDLQGSKWRVGSFVPFELVKGQPVELVLAQEVRQPNILPVPHFDFFTAAGSSNGEIILNDAKIRLQVESAASERITARVVQGGVISTNKGITFASSTFRKEALSEKDRTILEQTRSFDNIRYAVSYVRDAEEMARYRLLMGPSVYLIAKLERGPAMRDALAIANHADALWVCRGDLGAELGLVEMAKAVSRFTAAVPEVKVPVIMAGQVLEHMTDNPTPTRSEVCYLYDALQQGYRGFVLSDEVAVGKYPVESVRTAALFKQAD